LKKREKMLRVICQRGFSQVSRPLRAAAGKKELDPVQQLYLAELQNIQKELEKKGKQAVTLTPKMKAEVKADVEAMLRRFDIKDINVEVPDTFKPSA